MTRKNSASLIGTYMTDPTSLEPVPENAEAPHAAALMREIIETYKIRRFPSSRIKQMAKIKSVDQVNRWLRGERRIGDGPRRRDRRGRGVRLLPRDLGAAEGFARTPARDRSGARAAPRRRSLPTAQGEGMDAGNRRARGRAHPRRAGGASAAATRRVEAARPAECRRVGEPPRRGVSAHGRPQDRRSTRRDPRRG